MSEYLPPMTGGQDRRVVPGPVRGGACPPPSEIVVVEVRKVFDFCFQEDSLERCFFVPGLGTGAAVTGCEITNVTCGEIMDREPIPDQDGLALVSLQINIDLSISIAATANATPTTVTRTISFPKRVVLCAPTGTDVSCDVRGTCICTVQPTTATTATTEPNVCCTIQLCVVNIVDAGRPASRPFGEAGLFACVEL
ncbi:MAG TPA: hypothetical protein VK464_03620 [Symbiobacteriaceae bacterium]|nr:hypothetical protein [Symbiobacteriaceae bacterium]